MNQQIAPCLWFTNEAKEAAEFYVSVFKNSKIETISYYPREGFEEHHQKEGTVLTVVFQLNGQRFTALNGREAFKFTEAVSFQVFCETQDEIDYFWERLSDGGEEGQCGWLKDKYGLSWQVVPSILGELITDPAIAGKVVEAFMPMKKFDIEILKKAAQD
ncbi:MAG: VOC family protein [Ginsengibacter sp.]